MSSIAHVYKPISIHVCRGGLDLPPHRPSGGGPLAQLCIFYELVVICCERYLIFALKRAIICHLEP